ncbi:protease PrsW [Paenibacillus psychroresistens]|uniref:Protease PrsW n=1 Tax=Paenibacillus psychroresistens TaxID=1778678 RepID=A0A6B8RM40_9BACL|nr:protease PrsW [Paenibacillus psychroresistens]
MDSTIKMIGAITPGICLLTYFYLKDKDQPEPLRLVFKMFIAGGLVVFPLIILQSIFTYFSPGVFLHSFIVSAFSEELIKWSLMYYLIFNHVEFDEHFDAIVYSVATAAGFATIENIFYVFLEQGSILSIIWNRAFLPVSAHALFGVTMGFYLGEMKIKGYKRFGLLALLLPILFHGLFNSILYWSDWLATVFILLFMVFLWIFNINRMNSALKEK